MPLKRPTGGSGDAGAAKALEHSVEMDTEVTVITGELSLHPDVVNGVEIPQPKAEFHTDSNDNSSNDSNDHSGDDSDDHSGDDSDDHSGDDNSGDIYTHLCVK